MAAVLLGLLAVCGALLLAVLAQPSQDTYSPAGTELYCLKCPPGHKVAEDCSLNLTLSVCTSCDLLHYSPESNGQSSCQPCSAENCTVNAVQVQACGNATDRVCECTAGFHRYTLDLQPDQTRFECMPHTACPPGEGQVFSGNHTHDRLCQSCEEGKTFANATNPDHPLCQACSPCPDDSEVLVSCSRLNDTQCSHDITSTSAPIVVTTTPATTTVELTTNGSTTVDTTTGLTSITVVVTTADGNATDGNATDDVTTSGIILVNTTAVGSTTLSSNVTTVNITTNGIAEEDVTMAPTAASSPPLSVAVIAGVVYLALVLAGVVAVILLIRRSDCPLGPRDKALLVCAVLLGIGVFVVIVIAITGCCRKRDNEGPVLYSVMNQNSGRDDLENGSTYIPVGNGNITGFAKLLPESEPAREDNPADGNSASDWKKDFILHKAFSLLPRLILVGWEPFVSLLPGWAFGRAKFNIQWSESLDSPEQLGGCLRKWQEECPDFVSKGSICYSLRANRLQAVIDRLEEEYDKYLHGG